LLSSAFEAAPSAAASSELAEAADAAVLSKVAVVVATPPEEPAAAAAADEPPAAAAAAAEPPRQWPEGVAPSAGTTVAVVSPLFLKKRLVGYTLTPTDGSEAMLLFSRRQGHLIPNAEGRVGLCHGEHVEVTCEEKEHDGKMVREVTSVAGPHGGAVQGVPPKPRTPKSTDANAPRAWPDGVEPSAGASVAVVRPLILNKRHVGAVLKPLDGSADALLFFQKHKKLIPNAPGTQGLRYGEHVEVTSVEKEHKGKMVREVTSVAGPHGGPVQGTPTKPKSELKKAEASTAVPVAAAPAQTFDEYMAKNGGPIPPGVEEVEVHAVDAKGVAQVTGRHWHYHRLHHCHCHRHTHLLRHPTCRAASRGSPSRRGAGSSGRRSTRRKSSSPRPTSWASCRRRREMRWSSSCRPCTATRPRRRRRWRRRRRRRRGRSRRRRWRKRSRPRRRWRTTPSRWATRRPPTPRCRRGPR